MDYPDKLDRKKASFCHTCGQTKITKLQFPKKSLRQVKRRGEELHHDWKPLLHLPSRQGYKGYHAIADKFSGKSFIMCLCTKGEVPQNLIYHKRVVENHTTLPVRVIQSDDASENKTKAIIIECRRTGTLLQQSQAGDQAQNGFIEATIKQLERIRKCLEKRSGLDKAMPSAWDKSIEYSSFLRNQWVRKVGDIYKSNDETWYGRDMKSYRALILTYGCFLTCLKDRKRLTASQDISYDAVFFGISKQKKAYVVLDIKARKWRTARSVRADEIPIFGHQ